MKVLLTAINAKYIHSNLAIYSLKAFVKNIDQQVELAEYTINNSKEEVINSIYEAKPDVLALSVYIWNVEYVRQIANELKKIMPGLKIWVGGPEVSYEPAKFLQENEWCDIVIVLEGEQTFKELLTEGDLSKIEGIVYRDNGIITNPPRPLIDMDELVFPYEDLKEFKNRIIYYESSRGCPFSCSYCLSSVEKSVRFRNLDKVKKELAFFLNNRVLQVKFVDRTFNCDHKRTKELWKFLIENDNGITNFHFEVSGDLLDEEEIELISKMRKGLIQLEMGVQSTYEPTIKEIKRSMRLEKLYSVVSRINEFGNTHQHLDLIAGLPLENIENFKKSFNDVYALNPQQLQLGFLKVLSGSYMSSMAESYEIAYTDYPPYEVLKTKWMSYDDIRQLKRIEDMVENYYNSGQYPNTCKYLVKYFDSPFDMYNKLAMFYTKNNLWGVNHSRIMRYNYLYSFAVLEGVDADVLAQIITYDLYLREKLKSRPSFALDLQKHKEYIRALFNGRLQEFKDKMCHIEPFKVDIETGEKFEKTRYYLFDYENKDMLTNYGRVTIIEEE